MLLASADFSRKGVMFWMNMNKEVWKRQQAWSIVWAESRASHIFSHSLILVTGYHWHLFFLPMLACVIAYSNKAFCPRSLSNACNRPTPVPSGTCSITFILWGEKNWNRGALSFSSVTWTVTWNYFTKLLQFTNPLTQLKLTNASQFLPQFCCIFLMTRARSVGCLAL